MANGGGGGGSSSSSSSMKTFDKDSLAVFYQLSDMDILEDWAVIQTSLHRSTPSPSSMFDSGDDNTDDDDNDTSRLLSLSNITCLKQEQFDYDENHS